MFDDIFNFSKQRSLKQSVGFFVFYGTIALAATTVIDLIGL